MAQGNGNSNENPEYGTISTLSGCLGLVGAGFFILEQWDSLRGPIDSYLIRKLPEYSEIAVMLAPWAVGAIAMFTMQLVIATVLKRVYDAVSGA